MKPIISPWLIYLINLFDDLKLLLIITLILLACITGGILLTWFFCIIDCYEDDNFIIKCKKYLKKSIVWLFINSLLFITIPSKDIMYTMLVLDNVTSDNIQAIGKTGKDVVDYIVNQIDKIVNNKDEKENK